MSDEWVETTLGEVADITIGKTPPRNEPKYWTTALDYPFCTIADMTDLDIDPVREGVTEAAIADRKAKRVPAGALLMSFKLSIGRIGFASRDIFPNEAIAWLNPKTENIDKRYLGYWLSAQDLTTGSGRAVKGSTLNGPSLRAIEVRVPPLPVQRRIVDLMTHLDSHLANLQAEQDACSRSASVLRSEMFSNLSGGTVRASEMFDMLLGRQKSARQSVGEYVLPYVRAANIGEHGLKLDDVQTMNFDPAEQAKYALLEDDILLVEGGSVGLAARWKGQINGVVGFDKHVIRLRARGGKSISEYGLQWAHWCRESGAFDEQATGITIRALGFGRASAMPVPNLSIEEQEEFCAPLAAAAALVARQQAEVDRLVSLRSSLLSLLLSAAIDIPDDYDVLLSKVA